MAARKLVVGFLEKIIIVEETVSSSCTAKLKKLTTENIYNNGNMSKILLSCNIGFPIFPVKTVISVKILSLVKIQHILDIFYIFLVYALLSRKCINANFVFYFK